MTAELPADLREAIALGIARGYYTHTCVEEIAPLITAALADAWDAAQRAFCNDMYAHAAHQDCDDPGECPTTPNPYAPAERSGWEDHAPAEPCGHRLTAGWTDAWGEHEQCADCGKYLPERGADHPMVFEDDDEPAAPCGVAQPADGSE